MENNRLVMIIFGATGFTGKYAVKNAARICKKQQMKFGIAGRRKEALEAIIKECDLDTENIPIFLADINDEESLKKMTQQATVLVNCCGPYQFYGEPVIKACIATRTHYVDVSGEPEYMETMQLKYNKAAQEIGVYIVNACGFDSIPCDLGIIFIQKKFGGEVNSVESYMHVSTIENVSGSILNYATWVSFLHSLARINELRELRLKLYPNKLPHFSPKLKARGILHQSDISEGWSTPFLGSDRSVVYRSQRFLYDNYKERPVQVQTYITFQSLFYTLMTAFLGIIIFIMNRSTCGRNILLKYPALFSYGMVSHENPKAETLESRNFCLTFKALGWSEKLAEPTDEHINQPNKELIAKVSGRDPGYDATSAMLILSAITIIKEADKMPNNGGVFPPGAAFSKTSLIEELNKDDIKFEVVSIIEK